jgi:hypothetical protein
MKTHWKQILAALTVAAAAGGSFVIAQSTPSVTVPSVSGSAPVPGPDRGGVRGSHQPHMDRAIVMLRNAREQLDMAEHDKGGYRERAIASIDQAIRDVQAGIDYAEAHPEEFPGARGPRGTGPRGTAGGETGG